MAGGRIYAATAAVPFAPAVGGRVFNASLNTPGGNYAGGLVFNASLQTPTFGNAAPPGGRVYAGSLQAPQANGAGGRVFGASLRLDGVPDINNVWCVVNGQKRKVVQVRAVSGGVPRRVDTLYGVKSGAKKVITPTPTIVPPPPPPDPTPITTPTQAVLNMIGGLGKGALWGYYASGDYEGNYRSVEQGSGRLFDITYRYYDVSLTGPDTKQMNLVNEGRIPHLAFTPRSYSGSYNTSLLPPPGGQGNCWLYSQMYDGSMDRWLDALATRLKNVLGTTDPYFLNFNEEPEGQIDYRRFMFSDPNYYTSGGSGTTRTDHKVAVLSEYSRAASYWTNYLIDKGVSNAVHVLCFASGRRTDWEFQALYYPECDVIAWDPYDGTDPYTRFAEFYNRIDGGLFDPVDLAAKNKPRGISEWGSLNSGSGITPTYISQVPSALKRLPKLIYAQQYSSGGSSIIGNQPATDAFDSASLDPYVNKRS